MQLKYEEQKGENNVSKSLLSVDSNYLSRDLISKEVTLPKTHKCFWDSAIVAAAGTSILLLGKNLRVGSCKYFWTLQLPDIAAVRTQSRDT